ncbi:hypothetical protein [Streptosporangium longisporum]|uniref:hypothetical protein n=1 Tax=Streptosporangium longisporum TaxID=46187 RepID=UPI0031E63F4B
MVAAAENAKTFDDLPDWLQKMITQAEGGSGSASATESGSGPQVSKRQQILTGQVSLTESAAAMQQSSTIKGRYKVLLIRPGWGSSGYYSEEVLKRDGSKAFPKGTQNYLNHPTVSERAERPGRRVQDWASVQVTDPVWDDEQDGLVAEVQVFPHWRHLLNEDFAREVGLSIRAAGTVEYGEAEGRTGPIVTSLDEGISVDWVTRAGAGGKVLALIESALTEGRNIGSWLEARLHQAFSTMADEMYGDGRLTRAERLSLSTAIGDALHAFTARLEDENPQLFSRDPYLDPRYGVGMVEDRGPAPTTVLPAAGVQAQQPPPAEPAAGPTDEEEDIMSTLSEGLRERLGITDADVAPDALLAALDEALAERADTSTPDPEPAAAPAPQLPPGAVIVDEAMLAKLQEQAQQGVAARAQQIVEERDRALNEAVKAGKFPPFRREHWARLWDADPDGTRQTLESLAENTVPLADLGEPGGEAVLNEEDAFFDRVFSTPGEA